MFTAVKKTFFTVYICVLASVYTQPNCSHAAGLRSSVFRINYQKGKYNTDLPGDGSFYMTLIPPRRSVQGLNRPAAPCCLLHPPPAAPLLGLDAPFHLPPGETARREEKKLLYLSPLLNAIYWATFSLSRCLYWNLSNINILTLRTWSLFFISSTWRSCSEDSTLSILCMSLIRRRCDSRNWSLARCHVCFSWLCCCLSNSSLWHTKLEFRKRREKLNHGHLKAYIHKNSSQNSTGAFLNVLM